MKVTDIRRKLAASLVAAGLMVPATASAANLNTNLVANPGFETVDINVSEGGYNAVQIQGWSGNAGFAYSHDGSLNGGGMAIPDYANGGTYTGGTAPAGTGSFYFTPGAADDPNDNPGEFFQDIDVSAGATGSLIATGEAAINMSALFSSFGGQGDFGTLHVEYLDSGSSSLGTLQVSDNDTTTWTLSSVGGGVPIGTATTRVSAYGTALGGTPDGYTDNVNVQITNISNAVMILEVNTTSGEAMIKNDTGESTHIDYYEIMSDSSLQSGNADWSSFQDQNMSGFPAGNGSGNGWEEAGGSDSGTLSESYLTGSSEVIDTAAHSLGDLFNTAGARDLTFKYGRLTDIVTLSADYNSDGIVGAEDYTVWRDTLGASVTAGTGADGDGSGIIDIGDYNLWDTEFGLRAGPSGTGTLTTGFVRYVTTSSLVSANVPEPSNVVLVSLGFTGLMLVARKRR